MWESLARVNAVVGGVGWGPVGLALLFGTGCLLTVRTGFFQLRYFGYWMRHTIGAIFLDRNVTAHTDDEAISQFQSLCTALAATIGTGNIVVWRRPFWQAGRGLCSGCGSWPCWG